MRGSFDRNSRGASPFRGRGMSGGGRGGRTDGGRGGSRGGSRGGRADGGRGGSRGGSRGGRGDGGRGGLGFKGGAKAVVAPHLRHPGIFVVKQKTDVLATLSLVPGVAVYGEKKVEVTNTDGTGETTKKEYRLWNPYRSKLASAIYNGIEQSHIVPGAKVLYLGAASGTTVSHVSDIVGAKGTVYAVEFSARSGRDLVDMCKKRPNVVPIIEDARHPWKYRMLVGMVDVIFMDVAQPDQARIMALNAQFYLKNGGAYVISIKANCIDSTLPAPVVFAKEVESLKKDGLKPREQVTLEPFERDHAVVCGVYRPAKKKS